MYQSGTNQSVDLAADSQDGYNKISFNTWDIVSIVDKTALGSVVCLFGVVCNIINLLVIIRQGFADPVNISFLGLTLSDIGGLISLLFSNMCANPLMIKFVEPPYAPEEFCFISAGVLRVFFSRLTCYVTIFITVQRCLCIAQPLKIKDLLSPKRTGIVLISIAVAVFFIHNFIVTCTGIAHIGWKFYPLKNKSLIGLVLTDNWDKLYSISTFIAAIFQVSSFMAIVLSTAVLVVQLKQKTKWRTSVVAFNSLKSKSFSQRDHKLGLMVVFLSGVFIVCDTPSMCILILSLCSPYISNVNSPASEFAFIWALTFLCEAVNSSVSIFVYYKVSSKFRSTLDSILYICIKDRKPLPIRK